MYEAKLLIVGEGGAGKTTLAKKIQDFDYQLPEENNDTSTEGIDVVPWKFNLDNGQEFCINIWDFGGQEIYHATHQFFLTKRSLYVLVADSRKENTDFYYWLNVVELLSDNSPLLIVNNEKLERKRDINEKALRGQFTNLEKTLSSNLKTNRGLPEILANIKHYIQHLPHIGQGLPKTWVKVRQALESDRRNHITLEEYLDICQENGFTLRKDKLQLSGYLHDLGVCLHFQESEDSLLHKTIILKPEWGTKAVYAVLDNDDVKGKQGCFTREDLKAIWHQDTYAEMRGELLELMKKFQLCYEIPSRKNTFIAPQLLSENQPDYQWREQNNLTLHYSYPDFMPKGLITRFIVTMHQYIERQDRVWKTGVVLVKDKAKAEVIEYYGRRKIEIRISGANKKDLMTLITYEIDKLSDSFNRLNYIKQIPCNCSVCKSNQVPHFYNFNKLKQFILDRQHQIQCQESYEMIDVLSLIDDVIIWQPENLERDFYQYHGRNNIIKPSKNRMPVRKITKREVYISYAWKEESEAITDLIDQTFNNKGISIVRDKKDLGFKGRIKQFMEEIARGKCVIVIISPKYLKSKNCMFELIEIASNGDFYDRIFPIVLSGTEIYDSLQRIEYIKYWEDQINKLNQAMKEVNAANLQGFREDLDLYTKIRHAIAKLTDTLRDMNTLPTDEHLKSEFKELLTAVINKLEE
ncbi:MAG: COR domain-containing protein [Cyanobacteria bacterium J06621_8]